MSVIAHNILLLKKELPSTVKLVAVSKTKTPEHVMEAYNAGQRAFGENRVQELLAKKDSLPPDIDWHLIGHLQTNKVKYVVPFAAMIQSVDSLKLLRTIDDEAQKCGRKIKCLLQVRIASESTKFGFDPREVDNIFSNDSPGSYTNVIHSGVMGMATFTDNEEQVRNEFRTLASCFRSLRERYFMNDGNFREISMGMSGDFRIAIEEGSTIVRIGSTIFGERIKGN